MCNNSAKKIVTIVALGLLFFITTNAFAFAQEATGTGGTAAVGSGNFDGLLQLIQQQSGQWFPKLHEYAVKLFWLLALIQLVVSFVPFVFRANDIGEFLAELVKFILVTGFFLALLNYSQEWGRAIIESFRTAASTASGRSSILTPGAVFEEAVNTALSLIMTTSIWSPVTSVLTAISALIVLLSFTFIAVFMAVTIIESYIVINASVIFMGFGASHWTREMTITAFRYAVAVGAKLMVLTLIVSLIIDSIHSWQAAYDNNSASMLTIVGLALACAYITKEVPDVVASLISGTSGGGGAMIGAMAGAAAGAAVAGVTIASGGAAAPAAAGMAEGGAGLGGGAAAAMGAEGAANGMGAATGGEMFAAGASNATAGSAAAHSQSAGLSPRVGGNTVGNNAANNANKSPNGVGGASKPDGSVSGSAGGNGSGRSAAASLVRGGVRGLGVLSSISVPGMEGAENLSVGTAAPPPPPIPDDAPAVDIRSSGNEANEVKTENTISAASSEPTGDEMKTSAKTKNNVNPMEKDDE